MEANEYWEKVKELSLHIKQKGTGISFEQLLSLLLEDNAIIHRAGHPDTCLRSCDGDLYLCPVADSNRDGIQRIVAARKKQLAKWSVEHDSSCHGEPLLTAVVQDLLINHSDGFGITRKHPDRNDRLAIAGALIAAILDVRIAEQEQGDKRDAEVQQSRKKNAFAKLAALYNQIHATNQFDAGPCWCGYVGLADVKAAHLAPDSLHIKYECHNCELKGERKWLV